MAEYVLTRATSPFAYPSVLVTRVVNAIVGIIEFLLAIRFLFELATANQSSPFIASMYALTDNLVAPFQGAFPTYVIGTFPIDLSIILAMIVYAILGWAILALFSFIFVTVRSV